MTKDYHVTALKQRKKESIVGQWYINEGMNINMKYLNLILPKNWPASLVKKFARIWNTKNFCLTRIHPPLSPNLCSNICSWFDCLPVTFKSLLILFRNHFPLYITGLFLASLTLHTPFMIIPLLLGFFTYCSTKITTTVLIHISSHSNNTCILWTHH